MNGDKNKAKRLQYLLTHSFPAKAYAVRKVTTNKGKNTSGVDKRLWSTSASRMKVVLSLTNKHYKENHSNELILQNKVKTNTIWTNTFYNLYEYAETLIKGAEL